MYTYNYWSTHNNTNAYNILDGECATVGTFKNFHTM